MDPNERKAAQPPTQPPPTDDQQQRQQQQERNLHPNDLPPVRTREQAASVGDLAAPDLGHATVRNVSPSPSGRTAQPMATPISEGGEGGTEYFPPLDPQPSLLSIPSNIGGTNRPHSSSNASSAGAEPFRDSLRQPSIRIRRRSSSVKSNHGAMGVPSFGRLRSHDSLTAAAGNGEGSSASASTYASSSGRPRSISQPERAHVPQNPPRTSKRARRAPPQVAMPRLTEEGTRPTMEELGMDDGPTSPGASIPEEPANLARTRTEPGSGPSDGPPRLQRMRKMSRMFWPRRQSETGPKLPMTEQQIRDEEQAREQARAEEEYNERLVDYLDTIDPEVQTLSTLTNVQNSLFIPDLGKWVNRRPTYNLSEHDLEAEIPKAVTKPLPPIPASEQMGEIPEDRLAEAAEADSIISEIRPELQRSSTITSRLTESHYAALPHGATLEGWTVEEKAELDDHVRHMLHSRRSKFKRTMKGFGQYVRRPLGFFVTLYAVLITLFGLAWVLFLIGWIYVGDKQIYVIHIIDSVLVALFAIMGDGLAPFRAIDTYHMIFVWRYAHIVQKEAKKARKKRMENGGSSPEAVDATNNDTGAQLEDPLRERGTNNSDAESPASIDPHAMRNNIVDAEDAKSGIDAYEDTPLTLKQQQRLYHHQSKLAKSHSFYKPQETNTHYAFPLGYLIAVVILLDCHSCLQISLGATTWGIDYRTRPVAITTVILCISITCNITAGIVISVGDRKTRKKDVWKLMNRQELTGDAMKEIEQKRSNSNKENRTGESDLETEKSKEAVDLSAIGKRD